MASLQKRKSYYYAYFYDSERTPQRKSYPLKTRDKRVARRRLVEAERRYHDGELDPWGSDHRPERPTAVRAADDFLKTKRHLRPATQRAYTLALEGTLLPTLPPGCLLIDISARHLRPLIYDADVSVATQRHRYRHLRTFFNWALKVGHIEKSPLEDVSQPKQQRKVAEFLTPAQLDSILETIEEDYQQKLAKSQARPGQITWLRDVILVAVNTGGRLSEVLSLRWTDVNLDTGFITFRNAGAHRTKSGHERSVPLSTQARDVLEGLQKSHQGDAGEYVFTSYTGGKLNANYTSKMFKKYVRLVGLPERFSFHSLRHTCASWLVQRGVSLKIVQVVLGHSSQAVTERYAHLAPGVMKDAVLKALG